MAILIEKHSFPFQNHDSTAKLIEKDEKSEKTNDREHMFFLKLRSNSEDYNSIEQKPEIRKYSLMPKVKTIEETKEENYSLDKSSIPKKNLKEEISQCDIYTYTAEENNSDYSSKVMIKLKSEKDSSDFSPLGHKKFTITLANSDNSDEVKVISPIYNEKSPNYEKTSLKFYKNYSDETSSQNLINSKTFMNTEIENQIVQKIQDKHNDYKTRVYIEEISRINNKKDSSDNEDSSKRSDNEKKEKDIGSSYKEFSSSLVLKDKFELIKGIKSQQKNETIIIDDKKCCILYNSFEILIMTNGKESMSEFCKNELIENWIKEKNDLNINENLNQEKKEDKLIELINFGEISFELCFISEL